MEMTLFVLCYFIFVFDFVFDKGYVFDFFCLELMSYVLDDYYCLEGGDFIVLVLGELIILEMLLWVEWL